MEPIAVGAGAAKFVGQHLASRFSKSIIERWTRHRAERFFDSLIEALGIDSESQGVDSILDDILSDEKKSEVLFDAYRRVCFSKSRDLGPRMIALLTGELIREGRMADENEEKLFEAAEILGDGEFLSFFKIYSDYAQKAAKEENRKSLYFEARDLIVVWNEETRDSTSPSGTQSEIDVGSLDLGVALGFWAVKLQSCNLLSNRITQKQQKYKHHINQEVTLSTYRSSLVFSSACETLRNLVARSLPRQQEAPNGPGHRN